MAPHVSDGQVVFLPARHVRQLRDGESAARSRRAARASRSPRPAPCPISRASTARLRWRSPCAPSGCRTGAFPARDSAHAFEVIRRAYPSIEPIEDALSGALMNAGPDHPSAADPDERRAARAFRALGHPQRGHAAARSARHRSRSTTSASRCARRSATRPTTSRCATTTRPTSGCTATRTTSSPNRATGASTSSCSTHRYMREDVAYGLAFLVSVARWAGVAAPVARGLLAHRRRRSAGPTF